MKTEEHTFRSKGTRWPFSQKKVNAVSLHSGRWSSISSLLLVRCSLYSAPKGEQGENATTSSSALWAPSNIWRFGLSSVYWSQLSHFFLVSATFLLRLQVDFFLGCQNNLVCIAIQSGRKQQYVDKSKFEIRGQATTVHNIPGKPGFFNTARPPKKNLKLKEKTQPRGGFSLHLWKLKKNLIFLSKL